MKIRFYFSACLLLISGIIYAQDIRHFLKLLNYEKHLQGELSANLSHVDSKKGFAEFKHKGEWYTSLVFQATYFKCSDDHIIVAATNHKSDQQCSFYHSHFYNYDHAKDTLTEISYKDILPELPFELFFNRKKVEAVLLKYMPEIKKAYMGSETSMDDILNEIYKCHFILPHHGTSIKATLHLCDYIGTNVVSFSKKDREQIETVKTITLHFNTALKRFEVIKK